MFELRLVTLGGEARNVRTLNRWIRRDGAVKPRLIAMVARGYFNGSDFTAARFARSVRGIRMRGCKGREIWQAADANVEL